MNSMFTHQNINVPKLDRNSSKELKAKFWNKLTEKTNQLNVHTNVRIVDSTAMFEWKIDLRCLGYDQGKQ